MSTSTRRNKPSTKRACTGCLWNWQNLLTGDINTCYNRESSCFHQEAKRGCTLYEKGVPKNALNQICKYLRERGAEP